MSDTTPITPAQVALDRVAEAFPGAARLPDRLSDRHRRAGHIPLPADPTIVDVLAYIAATYYTEAELDEMCRED